MLTSTAATTCKRSNHYLLPLAKNYDAIIILMIMMCQNK